MATFDINDLDVLLRDQTEPGVQSYIQNNAPIYKLFSQAPTPWDSARQKLDRIKKTNNTQIGFTAAEGELPNKGEPSFDKWTITPKYCYAQFEVSGLALEFGGGGPNSMTDLLTELEDDLKESYVKFMNRVMFGTGSGRMALVSAVNGTTITVDGPYDLGRYLRPNMTIAIINGSSGAIRGTATISSVTHTSNAAASFVVDATPGSTADNDIVVAGLQNTGASYNQEPWGLLYHCDDGSAITTYQGQSSRSSKPWAKAYVMSNSGTNQPLVYRLLAQLSAHRNIVSGQIQGKSHLFVMSSMMLMEYYKTVMGALRFKQGDTLDIGVPDTEKLKFDGKKFHIDDDCPYNHIFALTPEDFRFGVQTDFHFDDKGGSILRPDSSTNNKHKYWGTAYSIWNLWCRNPKSQAVLKDITEEWVAPE